MWNQKTIIGMMTIVTTFADDEEAASEEEGVSSSRASTSSNEEDDYLSEPTYHNVGWNMTKNSDTDAFSEEFDQRMRLGGRLSSYSVQHQVSTMPRPHPPQLPPISSLPTPQYPIPYDVSSLQRNSSRNNHQYSIPSGGSSSFNNHHSSSSSSPQVQPGSSTLSVSTSIHSTISCESDIEKYAQDNMNIQKRGLFRRKMTVKDILSWTSEGISKPLTCLSEKGSKKEAIELF
ncbi:ARHGAP39 [Lepeophtheirus salmonis]|uniref:ARHGAP39 n=1 Tax=Lepeophtheirus salmonis TaxID=72036 RepID=A0A7R8H666_LEPSM|nr:ARHGAP39 [Lepeophtheirus salmonis]CAF2875917.1 ARHGAP39 [Lepeophtheirus salmonis]